MWMINRPLSLRPASLDPGPTHFAIRVLRRMCIARRVQRTESQACKDSSPRLLPLRLPSVFATVHGCGLCELRASPPLAHFVGRGRDPALKIRCVLNPFAGRLIMVYDEFFITRNYYHATPTPLYLPLRCYYHSIAGRHQAVAPIQN